MATDITRELKLLRYNKVLPSSFNDIQLSEEIGESIATNTIIRWDSGNNPVTFPTTIVIGDKIRISSSTVSTNSLYTIANITTTTVTNDTIVLIADNGIDTLGSGTRTGGGVGNMIIFREANTSLGSVSQKFENIYTKSLEGVGTFILPNPTAQQDASFPTQPEHLANMAYVDYAVANYFPDRVFEEIGAPIIAGTPHVLPDGKTYFGDNPASAGDATFGRFLEIYRNGIKIYAGDTGFTRDYKETGTDTTGQTTVTFEFDLQIGDRLEYVIYKA